MEKRTKKIIPWRRHHLRLDVAVRKDNSPCRHADEVADAIVVALIFNRLAMEKTVPPYPLAVAGKEEEEINLPNQEIWHGEALTLKTRSTEKLIKNDGYPLPPASDNIPEVGGRGTVIVIATSQFNIKFGPHQLAVREAQASETLAIT